MKTGSNDGSTIVSFLVNVIAVSILAGCISGMIVAVLKIDEKAATAAGLVMAVLIVGFISFKKAQKRKKLKSKWEAGCELCGGPFQKTVYEVTVEGRRLTVCGFCGNRVLKRKSKDAVDAVFKADENA